MTNEEHLTLLIRNSETRAIDLKGSKKIKGMIREAYEHKMPEWFMKHLKELKNSEEKWLKELKEEQRYFRQGLNHPSCYRNG